MDENNDNEEKSEVAEIAENHLLDIEDAEHVKEIMDETGVDEDDAVELFEAGL